MRLIIFLLPLILLAKQNWFITKLEYGKMLYNDPRGISCAKCHGKYGQGKVIAKYYEIKNNKEILNILKAPNIQDIPFDKFKKQLFHKNLSVMPKYNYLTNQEINAIYLYIKSISPKPDKKNPHKKKKK